MLNEVKDTASAWAFVKEGWRMIKVYNWYDRTVMPYSTPVKVTSLLHEIADYSKCSSGSMDYLRSIARGLGNIMNSWEKFELEPDVDVVLNTTGEVKTVKESVANLIVESGVGKYLDDIFVEEMQKYYDEIDHSDYIVW